jgi:hypothetical protein
LYSIKLSNGIYDVKAVSYAEFSPIFGTKTVVIDNSNVTLDFVEASMFSGWHAIIVFLLLPVVIFALPGFVVAIAVYIFTKKRKLTVIGFVLGTIANFAVILLLLLYQIGVADLLGRWSLLLSAGIALTVVAVPIILLNKLNYGFVYPDGWELYVGEGDFPDKSIKKVISFEKKIFKDGSQVSVEIELIIKSATDLQEVKNEFKEGLEMSGLPILNETAISVNNISGYDILSGIPTWKLRQ